MRLLSLLFNYYRRLNSSYSISMTGMRSAARPPGVLCHIRLLSLLFNYYHNPCSITITTIHSQFLLKRIILKSWMRKKENFQILCSNFHRNVILRPSKMTLLDIGPEIWEHIQAKTFKVVSRIRSRNYVVGFGSKITPKTKKSLQEKLLNWKSFHIRSSQPGKNTFLLVSGNKKNYTTGHHSTRRHFCSDFRCRICEHLRSIFCCRVFVAKFWQPKCIFPD